MSPGDQGVEVLSLAPHLRVQRVRAGDGSSSVRTYGQV
jgi:hypothetical protein